MTGGFALRLLSLVLSALAFNACGKCGWGTYYIHGLGGYAGDGVITDTSQPSGLFGTRGYVVDFPKFDPRRPYQATYRFSGLPTLGRAKAEIDLMIEDPTGFRGHLVSEIDRFKETLTGTLTCSLVDSSGRVVTS